MSSVFAATAYCQEILTTFTRKAQKKSIQPQFVLGNIGHCSAETIGRNDLQYTKPFNRTTENFWTFIWNITNFHIFLFGINNVKIQKQLYPNFLTIVKKFEKLLCLLATPETSSITMNLSHFSISANIFSLSLLLGLKLFSKYSNSSSRSSTLDRYLHFKRLNFNFCVRLRVWYATTILPSEDYQNCYCNQFFVWIELIINLGLQ